VRFDQLVKRFDQLVKRFEQLVKRFDQLVKRFEQLVKRFDQLVKRFEQLVKRFDQLIKRALAVGKPTRDRAASLLGPWALGLVPGPWEPGRRAAAARKEGIEGGRAGCRKRRGAEDRTFRNETLGIASLVSMYKVLQ
jgi:hypothetical protein